LRLAFDTNVVVDVLLERAPFAEAARQLWVAVETGRVEGVIAAHALTTVWYLVSESAGSTGVSERKATYRARRRKGVRTRPGARGEARATR
jgi:predicted nucleic acid-binding protein